MYKCNEITRLKKYDTDKLQNAAARTEKIITGTTTVRKHDLLYTDYSVLAIKLLVKEKNTQN